MAKYLTPVTTHIERNSRRRRLPTLGERDICVTSCLVEVKEEALPLTVRYWGLQRVSNPVTSN
jgi:hypothetical protein